MPYGRTGSGLAKSLSLLRRRGTHYAPRADKPSSGRGDREARRTTTRCSLARCASDDRLRTQDLLALDIVLDELERTDPEAARIVEQRFFLGLEIVEIAAILGLSEATVKRQWRATKAWLQARLDAGR